MKKGRPAGLCFGVNVNDSEVNGPVRVSSITDDGGPSCGHVTVPLRPCPRDLTERPGGGNAVKYKTRRRGTIFCVRLRHSTITKSDSGTEEKS